MSEKLTEEEFFYEIMNVISEEIISDEYYEKNSTLVNVLCNELHDMYLMGEISVSSSRKVIERTFSALTKIGIR